MKRILPGNWSIALQITVAMLAAAIIPMFITAFQDLRLGLDSLERTEYENLQLLAGSTARRLEQLMNDVQSVVVMVANDARVVNFLSDPQNQDAGIRADEFLENVRLSNPEAYEFVYIMDHTAYVHISKTSQLSNIQGNSYPRRVYFQKAFLGSLYVDFYVGSTTGKLGLYFSAPIRKDGAVIGVAVVKISADAIYEIVEDIQAGQTGFAFLIDQDGLIVTHKVADWTYSSFGPLSAPLPGEPNPEYAAGQRYNLQGCTDPNDMSNCRINNLNIPELHKIVGLSTQGHTKYSTSLFDDGKEQIVGYAPMRHLDALQWQVVVNEPVDEFTADLNRLLRQTVINTVVVAVLVAVLAIGLAQYIANPIRQLTTAARALNQDDFEFALFRLKKASLKQNEIGELARVFVTMVKRMRDREKRLKARMTQQRMELKQAQRPTRSSRVISTSSQRTPRDDEYPE